jgi:hypothetical protein
VTGNITGGNVLGGANVNATTHTGSTVSVTSTVTGSQFNGSGAGLTSIPGANVTGTVPSATSATTAGTVTTAAQGNITSLGTLTSLSVTGNITGANVNGSSIIATPGNAYFKSSGADNFTISTFTNTPNPNFNINIGNGAGGIDRNPIYWGGASLNLSGNARADTGTPDLKIDAAGNLSAAGTIIVNSRANATAIANGATTGVGNIGASGAAFNTVFAKATTAQYADLAEMYAADAYYTPGTVLEFGGPEEITLSDSDMSTRIIGVVSTDPAHLMNSELQADHATAVALIGRVPCSVVGTVRRGDMMVSAGNGAARSESNPAPGSMIGKAVQDHHGDAGVIEILVGRL